MPTTKTCTTCKANKSLGEFHKDRGREDQRHMQCKTCAAEFGRRWYSENREKAKARAREHYQQYREVINSKNNTKHIQVKSITRKLATIPPGTPWTAEEDAFVMAHNDLTVYQKSIELGRTYESCAMRRKVLRKRLEVSPGEH